MPQAKLEHPLDAGRSPGPLQAKYVEPSGFQQGNKGSSGEWHGLGSNVSLNPRSFPAGFPAARAQRQAPLRGPAWNGCSVASRLYWVLALER